MNAAPVRVGDFTFSHETDFRRVAYDLAVWQQNQFGDDYVTLVPLHRTFEALLGTSFADGLASAVAEFLLDSRWRMQSYAADFLEVISGIAPESAGVTSMLVIIDEHPDLFAFGPTCSLIGALEKLICRRDPRAIAIGQKQSEFCGVTVRRALANIG